MDNPVLNGVDCWLHPGDGYGARLICKRAKCRSVDNGEPCPQDVQRGGDSGAGFRGDPVDIRCIVIDTVFSAALH